MSLDFNVYWDGNTKCETMFMYSVDVSILVYINGRKELSDDDNLGL